MSATSSLDFAAAAARASCVRVVKHFAADTLTPVAAFLTLAELSDHAFLLEGYGPAEPRRRYSFLGKDPAIVLRQQGTGAVLERHGVMTSVDEPFVVVLERTLSRYRAEAAPGLPPFLGGAVGYVGVEAASASVPSAPDDADDPRHRSRPHAEFMIFDTVLVFDHLHDRLFIVANAWINEGESVEAQYRFACARISFLERELERSLSRSATLAPVVSPVGTDAGARLEGAVSRARLAASGGSGIEVMVYQTATANLPDPFSFYRALRYTAPSTYMFFWKCGTRVVCGSSEETLMRVDSPVWGKSELDRLRLSELVSRVSSSSVCGVPAGAVRARVVEAATPIRSMIGGAVGYVDFAGALEFCTASRVMTVDGPHACVEVGAPIGSSAAGEPMSNGRDIETLLQTLASHETVR